jgi:hypothetical protein
MPKTTARGFRFARLSWTAMLFVLLGLAGQCAWADASCDRACLKGIVDQYTAAMAAHDPSMAPFADSVKFTENGQTLTLHQGLWATAAADSTYRLYVLDTDDESAGFLGLMREHEDPVLVALRLKVMGEKITEAEQIVSRPQGGRSIDPKTFEKPLPILMEKLKPAEQVSPDEMQAAANHYFTGLDTENSGANVPFDPNCQRRENGMITAGNPNGKGMAKLGCKAQFDTGFSVLVSDVRDRRFPVIDPETGLVFALVFFDHNGRAKQYTQPDGTVVPIKPPFTQPLTLEIAEIFKIQSGKIRQIEALINQVPYKMPSGWN